MKQLTLFLLASITFLPAAMAETSATAVLPATASSFSLNPGANLSITYRWNAVKTATSNTVFVHFVDKNGKISFQGDYAPSPATNNTAWKGLLSQQRQVTIPAALPAGTYSIRVGLYNKNGRLILTAGSGVVADTERRYIVGNLNVIAKTAPAPAPVPPAPVPPAPVPPTSGGLAPNSIPPGPLASDLNITAYGAIGDGKTDNSRAIQNAINAAASKGVRVYVPAGVFAHAEMIYLNGVKMNGSGVASVLLSTNGNNEPIVLQGNGPVLSNVKVATTYGGARMYAGWNSAVWIDRASNFQVDHVLVDKAASIGILNYGGTNGKITNNTVINTLADAIHNTYRAAYILVDGNYIENVADDGVAVVSYMADGGITHDITATNNVIKNLTWGRNMSVVGGQNILYKNNYASGNPRAACLYLSAEPPGNYNTYGDHNVRTENNTLENCGSVITGHGAVMMWAPSNVLDASNGIVVQNTVIRLTGQPGIVLNGPKTYNVSLINNSLQGQSFNNFGAAGQVITNTAWTSGAIGYTPAPAGVNGLIVKLP